jgi:hypothetical protein
VAKEMNMILSNLKQPPFDTSLMGTVRGALDYYGNPISDAMAYGGSGHAFLINVHEVICPSGPYVWKMDNFLRLLGNLGLEIVDLGFVSGGSPPAERERIESEVRKQLDAGRPCMVGNMDNQLIHGYESDRLLLIQPWPCVTDVTPATLTFGSWAEFGNEIHAGFSAFRKVDGKSFDTIVRESLAYALDLFNNPTVHNVEKYGIGPRAYDNWIKGVQNGHGSSHGNWWNGVVWSECRSRAADYMAEIAERGPDRVKAPARELVPKYRRIAAGLKQVSEKALPEQEKIGLLRELQKDELAAVSLIAGLVKTWG